MDDAENEATNQHLQGNDRPVDWRKEDEPRKEERRPTVNVMCSVPSGLVLNLIEQPTDEAHLPPNFGVGYRCELKPGPNPGIDKGFFDYWSRANKNFTPLQQGLIVATDEEPPEDERDAAREDRDRHDAEHDEGDEGTDREQAAADDEERKELGQRH